MICARCQQPITSDQDYTTVGTFHFHTDYQGICAPHDTRTAKCPNGHMDRLVCLAEGCKPS